MPKTTDSNKRNRRHARTKQTEKAAIFPNPQACELKCGRPAMTGSTLCLEHAHDASELAQLGANIDKANKGK